MFNEEGNHIDELFRSVLKDHQETPPASAWDNIVEKRSFGHIVMNQISLNWKNFLFLTFVFATAGIAVIMATDGSEKQSKAQNIADQVQQNNSGRSEMSNHLQLAYNEPGGGIIHGMRQAGNTSYHIINHSTESIIHSNNTIVKSPIQKGPSANNKSTPTTESKIVKPQNSQGLAKLISNKKSRADKINDFKAAKKSNSIGSIAYNSGRINENEKIGNGLINNFESNEYTQGFDLTNKYIDLLSSKEISSLTSLEDKFLLLDSNYYKPETRKKLTFKNHLFVSLKAGPEFNQSIYTVKSGEFNDYAKLKKESTSSKVGGSIQMTLSYYLHNNLFIETGFRYNQLREQVKYESFTVISETIVYDSTLLGYKVGPTGEPIAIYDINERKEIEKDVSNNSSTNVYHMLSVPLLVGYQVDFNRFSVQLKTGASSTLFSARKGTTVGVDENQSIALGGSSDPYKNSILWNWEVAAGLGYQLNENVSVIVEPNFRTSLNPITKSDFGVSEKNKTFGFLTGIRIKL